MLTRTFFSSAPIALEKEWKSTMETASLRTLSPQMAKFPMTQCAKKLQRMDSE